MNTTTATHPAIRITSEQTDALLRALERGRANGLPVTCLDPAGLEPPTVAHYTVGSVSEPWRAHTVTLWRDEHGTSEGVCDCTAGSFGRVCQHLALALDAVGWLPTEPAPEPELPVACPWCGSVDGLHASWQLTTPGGWKWRVRCLDCRSQLGYAVTLDAATLRGLCATAKAVAA